MQILRHNMRQASQPRTKSIMQACKNCLPSFAGAALDIMTPGGDVTVDQNGDGYDDGILQQTFDADPLDFVYYFYQVTSMAAPMLAGQPLS